MRFFKYIIKHKVDILFVLLILIFWYIYSIHYMTTSRVNWYVEMNNQVVLLLNEIYKFIEINL